MILSVKYNAVFYSPHEYSKKLETILFNFKKGRKRKVIDVYKSTEYLAR
ncbi:MAG: hypothetical protein J6581_04725 [Apibacter sp.]|jgi:hypothetical protein|nr:hypothetical protein [Apibacter sp.]